MSANADRSSSWRTSTLHCRPCVPRSGGGGDPATWSQYPATQDIDVGCYRIVDVSGINFCDGSYVGHGNSFDITSGETIIINSTKDTEIQHYDTTGTIMETRVVVEDNGIMRISGQNANDGRFIQTSTQPYPLSLYVSKSGDDTSGTGSESNPFQTIQKAITVAETLPATTNPYDFPTIYVDAGLYLEKLTITKNLTIIGITQYLANNIAAYGGQHTTRIGDNLGTNFVDIRSAVAGHVVRFENLDFRCRISNMEAGAPTNAVNLYMSYCNINRGTEATPVLHISGVSSSVLSNVFLSNTRSNGGCSDPLFAVYEFPNTNVYLEECRWNGTPVGVGIMRTSRAVTMANCEIRYIGTTTPAITNLPVIVLNFGGGQTARFVNTTLSLEYSNLKTAGANLITVPAGAPFGATPTIQLDNCYMLFRNATSANYILQNQSGKNISLQFHRPSSMGVSTGNSVIDYNNINITDTSAVITSTNNFRSGTAITTIDLTSLATQGELRVDDVDAAMVMDSASNILIRSSGTGVKLEGGNNVCIAPIGAGTFTGDSTAASLCFGDTTAYTGAGNAVGIQAQSAGLNITKWLKIFIGTTPYWIPMLNSDPTV